MTGTNGSRRGGDSEPKKILQVLILSLTFLGVEASYANPVLNNVEAGDVSIQQTPGNTQINQGSQNAIINWNSFNIDAGEKTHFEQPANGVALNRISPYQGASQIYGQLTATGRIILVNQAGIFFGPGSHVDVGGLIASTANISNENFLAGKYVFDQPSASPASIVNRGTIIAKENGLVALMGSNVSNEGVIEARAGHVVLASGSKFTVDMYGDQLINFAVDAEATGAAKDPEGNTMRDGVRNKGKILADGGKVRMTARVAKNVVDRAINMDGVVEANTIHQRGGEIILAAAGDDSIVRVAGKIKASGKSVGHKAGKVKIISKRILVDRGAKIDVSGDAGGGEVLIGGNYQGKGPLPNATATVIMPETEINADAITTGNGGTVIAWADDVTRFNGKISARGGALGGDGGFVETSGKNILSIQTGDVDVSAPNGKSGEWLLDPFNVTISSGSSSNINGSFTATGDDAIVNVSSLTTALGSGNVTVSTGSSGSQSGNITVSDAITWSSANVLTLSAANNIIINAAINASLGGLTLSAVDAAASITTGSGGTIAVKNFILSQGRWSQNTASLPSFSATNNFQLNSGSQFLRVTGGSGTTGSPYQITDVYGLQGAATLTLSNSYILQNNISASGTSTWNSSAGFVPIGNISNAYTGNFNGSGYTINDLTINSSSTNYVGLFGQATLSSNSIQNVGLINSSVTGGGTNDSAVGALIGKMTSGTVSNSFATGSVTESSGGGCSIGCGTGGLIGQLSGGTVSTSYANVTVNGINNGGGFVGFNGGTVSDSYALGAVTGGGNFGGFVGYNGGTIARAYSTGAVSSGGGGFAGHIQATGISNSYWDTTTSGRSSGFNSGFTPTSLTGLTTANALSSSNYTGFTIGQLHGSNTTATWYQLDSSTRPILAMELPSSNIIQTAHALQLIAKNTTSLGVSASYTVGQSINMSGTSSASDVWAGSTGGGFVPIGTSSAAYQADFDGGSASGYTISNLFINKNIADVGLFGYADNSSATISNLTLSSVNITQNVNNGHVGAVIGTLSRGTLSNANASGTVTEGSSTSSSNVAYVGGLVGQLITNPGSISNSNSSVTVVNHNMGNEGGIAGYVAGSSNASRVTITDSYNTGSVSNDNTNNNANNYGAGGIAGATQYATLTGVYNTGAITGKTTQIGGLSGLLDSATITKSYNYGTVTVNNNIASLQVGGLVGRAGQVSSDGITISNSFNAGPVISQAGNAGNNSIGGIVGRVENSASNLISNVYNSGTLSSAASSFKDFLGGIIGAASGSISIQNSYNVGNMISTGTLAAQTGGINGTNSGSPAYSGVYWNTLTSGQSLPVGGLGSTPSGTTAVTSLANMMTSGTFTSFTFDSSNWGIIAGTSFPYLTQIFSSTPRVISGTSDASANTTITLAKNGTALTSGGLTQATAPIFNSASSGFYYFLEGSSVISDGDAVLAYLPSSAGSAVTSASGSISGLTLNSGRVNVGDAGTKTITNAILGTAAGSLGIANTRYSVSSGNLTLADVNFATSATTTYDIIGDITANAGAANTLTFAGPVTVTSGTPTITSTGTQTYSSTVALTGSPTFTAGSNAINFNGVISGAGGLTKSGSGTMTYNAANTYSGATNISAGTLALGVANSSLGNSAFTVGGTFNLANFAASIGSLTGAGNVTLGSGIITVGANNTSTSFDGVVSGTGGLTKSGTGTLTFNGANTYTGTTTINAGTLALGASNVLGSGAVTIDGSSAILSLGSNSDSVGTVTLANGGTISGSGTLTSTGSFELQSGTVSAILGGAVALNKSTSSSVTLSGANTYSGTTTINAGTLVAANAAALGSTAGGTTVGSSGTLQIAGVAIGTEAINLAGVLTGTGTSSLSGDITLSALSSIGTSSSGDAFTLSGAMDGGFGLTLQGDGTTNLSGAVGSGTALSSLTSNAGTTGISNNITTSGNQTFNNSVSVGGTSTLTTSTGNIVLSGGISGANNLTLAGSGNNNFTVGGALSLNNLTVSGGSGTNTLTAQTSGATQAWAVSAANSGSLGGTGLSGAFSFSGIQNLTGGSNADTFALSGGTLGGSIDGGAGTNSLTADGTTNSWSITGNNSGTVTGVSGGFSNIQNIIGGSGNDTFTLSGGSVTGAINGGSGTNTLAANNIANTWSITGSNSGSVNNVGSFSNIQNMTGGTTTNSFVFSNGATVGTIDGGSSATNTLDFRTNYTNKVDFEFSGDGVGVVKQSGATVANFSRINNILNAGQGSITLPNKAVNSITLTGYGRGFINDPVDFTGFNQITGAGHTTLNTAAGVTVISFNPVTGEVVMSDGTMTFSGVTTYNISTAQVTITGIAGEEIVKAITPYTSTSNTTQSTSVDNTGPASATATATSESSSSTSTSAAPALPAAAPVDSNVAAINTAEAQTDAKIASEVTATTNCQ